MKTFKGLLSLLIVGVLLGTHANICLAQPSTSLPLGVTANWNLSQAYREATPTRERVCINGLWNWQPAEGATVRVPSDGWGYFKVPGCWLGITDYMQKDCQTLFTHPRWKDTNLSSLTSAWYQREITIPKGWSGRHVALHMEYLNSYAVVYINGKRIGDIHFPSGETDLTSVCRPGQKYTLSLYVVAMPLKAVMLSYIDTSSASEIKGSVPRRGLCGDVFLVSTPPRAHITNVKIDTSVQKGTISVRTGVSGLQKDRRYTLHTTITDQGRSVKEFASPTFLASDLKEGRIAFSTKWRPAKLWDLNTPENQYHLRVSLQEASGVVQDTSYPMRFGFREFYIKGKDFYLNGTRLYLSAVPLDNAQIGAELSSYEGAKESLRRLQSFGINFVYTHNYDCEPGSHLSFTEILRAADDVGMLVALTQPHFSHYEWNTPGAERTNNYARHAEFYANVAQNHPSVVAYSMSHNATGYNEDMNPDMIDGIQADRDQWASRNADMALRAEAIVKHIDPERIVYHHAGGNIGAIHSSNFYPNFVPIQELSDWFAHWSTAGVKPVFLCEYGGPFTWDWTMYRGWYKGQRNWGSAEAPWEYCIAEWNAQFLGERAYQITERERVNLRWEAQQFQKGGGWHRWDYPYQVGSKLFEEEHTVLGMYVEDNWRSFRTWGVSGTSPWEHDHFWGLRDGVNRGRKELNVDWKNLQRPGFSADYLDQQYERFDLAYERSDWVPTAEGQALLRNNGATLAYIGGKTARFTSKDHHFHAGDTVEKQLILLNNSRQTLECDFAWSLSLPHLLIGAQSVTLATGNQKRIPLRFTLPADTAPGIYRLTAHVQFSNQTTHEDTFVIQVLPKTPPVASKANIALFDPKGETATLLKSLRVPFQSVQVTSDLTGYDVLVIGKEAMTLEGAVPNISRVRRGLKVILFEQSSEVLEKRFGFRVEEYGLRQAFQRVAKHPLLAGLQPDNLRDWQGEATLLPSRLKYSMRAMYGPTIQWCGIDVTRVWRRGCQGNVASVLIEKPARGDFRPIVDGGYSLQYSPLMEYREGTGLVLFCQMDVTGRTEIEPAAERLARNILDYVSDWKPSPNREALYIGDPAGKNYLETCGVTVHPYAGGSLSQEQVLIVGPGGGELLAQSKASLSAWIQKGGHLLALGLDEKGANAFLPFQVSMKRAEHISAYFDAPSEDSAFAGISPAEVHNRAPRELSLLTEGVTSLGNGVLATRENTHVVFCQLVPWEFDYTKQMNLKRTYRHLAVLVSRLLSNMGVAESTPLLDRFPTPLSAASTERRYLTGFYHDQPEEWDDPYRFFRW